MSASCSAVSLRARARYRRGEVVSRREGRRGADASSERMSGNGMRARPSRWIEDAEAIPVASKISDLTLLSIGLASCFGTQVTTASG
jgi:hypothetical protein